MIKQLTKITILPLLMGLLFADDWVIESIYLDLGLGRTDAGGIHGCEMAPDGNIWIVGYGSVLATADDTLINGTDTTLVRPIWVLDGDGAHASFSPIRFVTNADGSADTLDNSARGLSLDQNGNLVYSYYNELLRFNYMTGELMDRYFPAYDDAGSTSSLTEATVDDAGNIYVSWVGGAGRPVVKISPDMTSQSTVYSTGVNYNRSTTVSPSGDALYMGSTWGSGGITALVANTLGTAFEHGMQYGEVQHTWDVYDITYDTTIAGTDTTITADTVTTSTTGGVDIWAETLDWNLGVLWAGETDPGWYSSFDEGITSPHPYAGEWIGFDTGNSGAIVDNLGVGQSVQATDDASALAATGVTCNPRAMAKSADGMTLYVADFSTSVIQKWTNANPVTLTIDDDSQDDSPIVAKGYALNQAYPNPFNPSTTISYEVGRTGNATLKVFNLRGELIRILKEGWHFNGRHQVSWDGKDNSGMQVPSGTYIYRLSSAEVSFSKRVTFMK